VQDDPKGNLVQVSCQLEGVEEVQDIKRARSSREESVREEGGSKKRTRSVENVMRIRVMSEGRNMVSKENQAIVRETMTQGGEGGAGTVFEPMTTLPSNTSKGPRKAVVGSEVRGTSRSQTAPGRRLSRVENIGREGSRLERVLTTKNDASLGLRQVQVEGKGRGVLTTKRFLKGEPVVEYKGILLSYSEAKAKQDSGGDPTYMYYHGGVQSYCSRPQRFCVDASWDSGKFGRLVNHSKKKPNCEVKVEMVHKEPHLILVALHDIGVGEELTYDYGIKDKAYMKANQWIENS